jgi:hypothetical protein
MAMVKSKITYDLWLQMYKGVDIHTITLKEHTRWCVQFAAWKSGNIEKA